jgi:hypothetical protein
VSDLPSQAAACARCSSASGPAAAPFARSVRHAIHVNDLSLREAAGLLAPYGQLASGFATLSDWQNGVCVPIPTDRGVGRVLALERCLGVPAGDLVLSLPGLAAAAVPRRRSADPLTLRRVALEQDVVRRIGPQRVVPVWTAKEYRIGWLRAPVMTVIRTTVRALHDGVDRYVFLHAPSPHIHPTVLGVSGCSVGDIVRERPRPAAMAAGPRPHDVDLAAVELRFDRRLRKGERYEFTFSVGYVRERPVEPFFRHVQVQPCERLHLALTFDPASPPATVSECRWREADLRLEVDRRRTLPGCLAYELVAADPVPGGYGWRWDLGPLPGAPPTAGRGQRSRSSAA